MRQGELTALKGTDVDFHERSSRSTERLLIRLARPEGFEPPTLRSEV